MDRNSSGAKADSVSKVALRKESVDRNGIEVDGASYDVVALRKESVDRNYSANAVDQILPGRSPQGERG